jgi:hypothetical protein
MFNLFHSRKSQKNPAKNNTDLDTDKNIRLLDILKYVISCVEIAVISFDINEMTQFIALVFSDQIVSIIVVHITTLSVSSYDKNEINLAEELNPDISDTDEMTNTGDVHSMEGYIFVYAITYVLESISKYIINANEGETGVNLGVNDVLPTGVETGVNYDDDSLNYQKFEYLGESIDSVKKNIHQKKTILIFDNDNNDNNNNNGDDNDNNNGDDNGNNKNNVNDGNSSDKKIKNRSKDMIILLLCFLPLYSTSPLMIILLDTMDGKMKQKLLNILQNKIFEIIRNEKFIDNSSIIFKTITYMCMIRNRAIQR